MARKFLPQELRKCVKCKEEKHITEFKGTGKNRDGMCKKCRRMTNAGIKESSHLIIIG